MNRREQLEQWQLEDSTAEAYERYLVPLLFAPGAQYLVELAELRTGERVLDAACGTGIVARTAAPRVGADGRVTGLDLNESMLKVARKISSEIHPEIEWKKGNVSDTPFPDAAFDVVFCQQGLQFFPDQSAALGEMHRVLAPNGRLVLSVLRPIEHNPGWALLAEAFERHIGPDAGAMMRSPFSSLSTTDTVRDLIANAGFREVRVLIGIGPARYPSVEEFVRWELASSPIGIALESKGYLKDDAHAALIPELRELVRVYTDDDGITFPAETYLVVAHQ